MKKNLSIGVLAIILFLMWGWSCPSFAEKILRLGVKSGDMGMLDPKLSATTANIPIMDTLYNGLVRFRPGSVSLDSIEPDLAERWTHSPDKKVWIFYLRKGVQFHKEFGELTAEDVVWNLERSRRNETSIFANRYTAYSKVEALDRYTVQITLSQNIPSIYESTIASRGGLVICPKAFEKYGKDFQLNPVGTGPFEFESYTPKQRAVLKANEKYFRGRPKIDKIIYRFLPVLQSRQMAFEKGELDMIEGEKAEWWPNKMRENKDVIIDILPPGEMTFINFNMTRKPLDNLKVRQALAHAINRKEWRESYGMSITGEAVSPVPPGYLGYTDKVKIYEYDLKKAKALLAEAGHPDGFPLGKVISSVIFINSAELLQAQLAKIGVKFDIQMVDHPTMHKMNRQDIAPIVIFGTGTFPVADSYLRPFYYGKSIVGTSTAMYNFSHYEAADQLIDAAASEVDSKKQIELWHKAQQKITEDVPIYPCRVAYLVFARKKNIDLGYKLESNLALHYQITENTDIH
jgi:peptide/nickel transport system substrate-binding protein